MSSEEFEQRINNKIEALLESQGRNDAEIAKILEVVTGMIQVARLHDDRIDRIEKQTEENSKQIALLTEQGKEQQERINALIRIVEGHLSKHP